MATGFLARYNGKIKVAQLWLDPAGTSGLDGIVDADGGLRFGVAGGIAFALPVTATANTDFTMSIPPGARIASMTVYTTTAYGAATDCKIEIGTSAGDNSYVAQTSIKAAGIVLLTPATSPLAPQRFCRCRRVRRSLDSSIIARPEQLRNRRGDARRRFRPDLKPRPMTILANKSEAA